MNRSDNQFYCLVVRPNQGRHMIAIPISTSADTRKSLIEAGLACFAKYGYDATSIRLVASMAGKNSSLISYYFKNKEGLYRVVVQHLLTRFTTRPVEGWPSDLDFSDTSEEGTKRKLNSLIRRILTEVDAHFKSSDPLRNAAVRLFLSELQSPKDEVKDLLREKMAHSICEIRECIRAIRPDISAADIDFWGITLQGCCVCHALMAEINGLVWTSADPNLSIEVMADRLTDFVFSGLGRHERPREALPSH